MKCPHCQNDFQAEEDADDRLARTPCSAWRDPETDPPTKTGKILIWIEGIGPSIVNVEERWMCYWNGNDETEPTAPHEWDWWMEISPPNVTSEGSPPSRIENKQEWNGDSLH
jgi:hypothetical protein